MSVERPPALVVDIEAEIVFTDPAVLEAVRDGQRALDETIAHLVAEATKEHCASCLFDASEPGEMLYECIDCHTIVCTACSEDAPGCQVRCILCHEEHEKAQR